MLLADPGPVYLYRFLSGFAGEKVCAQSVSENAAEGRFWSNASKILW